MSNWKRYGGKNKLDNLNNVSVNSFVADSFTLRSLYYGTFDISGELHVSGNLVTEGTVEVSTLNVTDTIVTSNLTVTGSTTIDVDMGIVGDLDVNGNATVNSDMSIRGNLQLRKTLFLGNSGVAYIEGKDTTGKIGINTSNPSSAVDIYSSYASALNVASNTSTTYNTLARSSENKGIVLYTSPTTNQIQFYNDKSIATNVPDGLIQYTQNGNLTVDVADNTAILSKLSVSNRPTPSSEHLLGETVIVYDTPETTPYLFPVYQNPDSKSGQSVSLITSDTSSVTFMNMVTSTKSGFAIGGGAYPNDTKRPMGTFGMRNAAGTYSPSINIVSGASVLRKKSTVAVNHHSPETDAYVLNVNGPIHLTNGELTLTQQLSTEIIQIGICRSSPSFMVMAGSPTTVTNPYRQPILYTNNGGETWNQSTDLFGTSIENTPVIFRGVYAFDTNLSIIAGDFGRASYTYNGGVNWPSIIGQNTASTIHCVYMTRLPNNYIRTFFGYSTGTVQWFDLSSNIYTNAIGTNITTNTNGSFTVSPASSILKIDGYGNDVYVLTNTILYKYDINGTLVNTDLQSATPYRSLSVLDSTHAVVVGTNVVRYLSGSTWNTSTAFPNYQFNDVYVFDVSNAIAVGNGGKIAYTNNGYATWQPIPDSILNTSGNAARLTDTSYDLTTVVMLDTSNYAVGKRIRAYNHTTQSIGNTHLFHLYLPNLLNNPTNFVLDVSGSVRLSGDIHINDGGKLASNNTSFSLLQNNVNTIYFGNDASLILMGNTASTVKTNANLSVGNTLTVSGNLVGLADTSLNGRLFVGNDGSFNNHVWVAKTMTASGNLVGLADTSLNGRLFVGNDASLNSKLWVGNTISASGNLIGLADTSLNGRLFVSNDSSLNSKLWVGSTITASGNLVGLADTSLNGKLFVSGDSSFNGNVWCNNSNVIFSRYYDNNSDIYLGSVDVSGITNRKIQIGSLIPNAYTKNSIYIGGVSDTVIINNVTINGSVSNITKTILLNASGGTNSSFGAGLYIYDNSVNTAGYMIVSNDRNGMIFKTPNSSNVVNMKISDLSVNSATIPNAGILTLYQTTGATPDSFFTMGVSPFDISNITLRNLTNSTTSQQVIDTSMSVLGQMGVGKYTGMIANAQLDVNGNTMVSRLGIGTNAVKTSINNVSSLGGGTSSICLEVSGNIYQNTGGYIWQF